MKNLLELVIFTLPAWMMVFLFIFTRNKSLLIKFLSALAWLVISVPISGLLVGAYFHIDFTRGNDHNPGVGVIFVPLLVTWFLTAAASLGYLIVLLILANFRKKLA